MYNSVEIEFDPAKDVANVAKHGISLGRAVELEAAVAVPDDRFTERRFRIYGWLDGMPHCLAATIRNGVLRAISLRRAHDKEWRRNVG